MRQKPFFRDQSGAVTVEFMLMLPLFLAFFVMSFVVFDTLKNETTTTKAAYTIGDMASRQVVLDNSYLDGLHSVFRAITRTEVGSSWLRFTSVTRTDTEFLVDWSYVSNADGSQDLALDNEIENWTANMPTLEVGETILFIETHRSFTAGLAPMFTQLESLSGTREFEILQIVPLRFTEQLVNTDFPDAFGTEFHDDGNAAL